MAVIEKTPPRVARKLRILIADDHEVVRRGLRTLLQTQWGWDVCGEAGTGCEAITKARVLQPDVVVIEARTLGIQAARQILSTMPCTEVLLLTADESVDAIRAASQVGARAILPKVDASSDLVPAVSALSRHQEFYTPRISGILSRRHASVCGTRPAEPETRLAGLTRRERDILVLIAEGHSDKQMARILNISFKTVQCHRRNLMCKTGLRSTAQLVRYAVRQGLVEP